MTRLRTSDRTSDRTPDRASVRTPLAATAVSASLLLAGCSGLGGQSALTCKLPDGARCDSVSSTYAESTRGELPGQRKRQATSEPAPSGAAHRGSDGMLMHTDPRMLQVGMPVRSQPRIVRVWIKAWEDSDGDLHDQTFVYLPVTEGRWMVEHKQREARSAYAPMRTSARTPAPALPPIRPTSLPPAPGAQTPPPAAAPPTAPSQAGRPTERMNEAVQRARSQQPASGVVRTEGGRNGS